MKSEPVPILVLSYVANEFSAMGTQAREDVIDIVDGEHDAPYTQHAHWGVLRFSLDRRRRLELGQIDPTVAIRGLHHRNRRRRISLRG